MFTPDYDSERATSIDDYKLTCIQFIEDISGDYKAWVARHKLPVEENLARKNTIDNIMKTTNYWIAHFGDTIKKIDVIKDDGINKMAENTAGYPFEFGILVGDESRYAHHPAGQVKLQVRAKAREGRKARICPYNKDQFVQILSSAPASVDSNKVSMDAKEILDEPVILDTSACKPSDVISITITVEEVTGDASVEKRGLTTLVRIK